MICILGWVDLQKFLQLWCGININLYFNHFSMKEFCPGGRGVCLQNQTVLRPKKVLHVTVSNSFYFDEI